MRRQLDSMVVAFYERDVLLTEMIDQLLDALLDPSVATSTLNEAYLSLLNDTDVCGSLRQMEGCIDKLESCMSSVARDPEVQEKYGLVEVDVRQKTAEEIRQEWEKGLKQLPSAGEVVMGPGNVCEVLQPRKFLTSVEESFQLDVGEKYLRMELAGETTGPVAVPESVLVEDVLWTEGEQLIPWLRVAFSARRLFGVCSRQQLDRLCVLLKHGAFKDLRKSAGISADDERAFRGAVGETLRYLREKPFKRSSWAAISCAAVSQGRQGQSDRLNFGTELPDVFAVFEEGRGTQSGHVFFPTFHETIYQSGLGELPPYKDGYAYQCSNGIIHLNLGQYSLKCPLCFVGSATKVKYADFTQ